MRTTTIIATATIAFLMLTWNQAANAAYRPAPDYIVAAAQRDKPPPKGTTAKRAWVVCQVFPRCRPAVNVFWCESSLRPWAANGQYLGIAQMGSAERATYGHGRTVWKQARAARRYHRVAGWGPWSCRP